ncbi:MAG: penicillin-binding transpeptidase domain-containing protein [Verrucomicrobiales bacterium]
MKSLTTFGSFAIAITMCSHSAAADRGKILDRHGEPLATGNGSYPAANAAAHLIGYCPAGEGQHGHGGIEEAFDAVLARGESIQLTIDRQLQTSTYKILQESGKRGAAVVVDPENGEILALVSYPSYDPNKLTKEDLKEQLAALSEAPNSPLLARAPEGTYPPASTFKAFSSLALMRASKAGAQTCSGTTEIDGESYRCWKTSGHGELPGIGAALRNSCNCYYYQAASDLQVSALVDVARTFGYGSPSGIEIKESTGALPSGNIQNAAIGHGDTEVTPLQIANAYAAIGNGGTLYKAHLIANKEPEKIRTIADEGFEAAHLEKVKAGLIEVVEHPEGTGRRAKLEGGMPTAGKTGTAAISDNHYAALFAGYAPVDEPRFAICVLQEGEASISGGQTSAPLAARILAKADALRKTHP